MKVLASAFQISLLLATTNAIAQVSGNYQYEVFNTWTPALRVASTGAFIQNNNEILVTINGLSNVVASNYVAVFNLVQVGETMESTDRLMNSRISNFNRKLSRIGIDTSDVMVDIISFVPKFVIQTEQRLFSRTYNEVPAGFELQKNVSVPYRSSVQLSKIISAAASAEIYDIVKVDYFIANVENLRDTLQEACLKELNERLQSFEVIGFTLDTMSKVMADDFKTVYPQTRYYNYKAASRQSLAEANKKITAEPARSASKFYNHVEFDAYDVVLNPVITEPVVQISYSITVKYFITKQEPAKNRYFIIGEGGQVTEIDP